MTAIMGYYGSKHRIAEWLIGLMPPHRCYVEPFAGSLSVLAAKPPVKLETVNDLDANLVTFWRVLRDRLEDLERACALTPHSRTEHGAAAKLVPDPYDEVEHARRVWVRLAQGRGGHLRSTGWRSYQSPSKAGAGMARLLDQYVGRFAAVAHRIKNVSLECRPALDVIADYGRDRETLLYVDPPYLASTRNSRSYAHEMPGEADHRELAEALLECEASVMVSGYPSTIYDGMYDGWSRYERASSTNQGNGQVSRIETVWCNRPANLLTLGAMA